MAATVLHFGTNDCNRVLVLRNAGYLVDDFSSINEFRTSLERDIQPEALVFSEAYAPDRHEAVTLARTSYSRSPLILFGNINHSEEESNFDLVIPPLTAPGVWLQDIADTIARSRDLQTSSAETREHSAGLRRESEILRQASEEERERAVRHRQEIEKLTREFQRVKAPDEA